MLSLAPSLLRSDSLQINKRIGGYNSITRMKVLDSIIQVRCTIIHLNPMTEADEIGDS